MAKVHRSMQRPRRAPGAYPGYIFQALTAPLCMRASAMTQFLNLKRAAAQLDWVVGVGAANL